MIYWYLYIILKQKKGSGSEDALIPTSPAYPRLRASNTNETTETRRQPSITYYIGLERLHDETTRSVALLRTWRRARETSYLQ